MKRKLFNYLFITILSLLIILPFLFDQVYIGHDTLFHLSRIQGYATSIKNGNFIPDIYILKMIILVMVVLYFIVIIYY